MTTLRFAPESIGIGGEHFTRDIAYGLRLPFSTAESIKRRYVFGLDYGGSVERVMIPGEGLATLSCGAIQSVIEARIVQLADEIQSIISGIEQNARARFPVYLYRRRNCAYARRHGKVFPTSRKARVCFHAADKPYERR